MPAAQPIWTQSTVSGCRIRALVPTLLFIHALLRPLHSSSGACSGKPVNSLFVAPAVTPVKDLWEADSNNPGVRLYQYDPLSYSIRVSKKGFCFMLAANDTTVAAGNSLVPLHI